MARIVSARTLAYVRSRALQVMTAQVQIVRWADPSMDETTLRVTASVPTTVYAGVARIQQVVGGAALIAGESVQPTVATAITIPFDAPVPRVDDVVLVSSFGPDDALDGDAFLIKSVGGGGLLRASRTLSCVAYQASRWWE